MNQFFSAVSAGFVPVMASVIIGYGLFKKAPVYDYFIEGAKSGLHTAVDILPFIIGIYIAVNGLSASGFLDFVHIVFRPVFEFLGIPAELLPLIFLRAVSGSGSFIILQNILQVCGPDSFAGRAACAMAGGCETVIYALALYFSVTGVKKTRHALTGGLIGYFTGVAASLVICSYL
ncbi:MAG: spore maturation protein [Firmicutes bacterium]|nr:spore maturation protein [Bacillota bacterium]